MAAKLRMSLLCTTRFDPALEAFVWNNAPDGSPSPYLLLAYQLDRLLSSAGLCRWTVSNVLDYPRLKSICDEAVRSVNGADGKTPLKIRVVWSPFGSITASAVPAEPLRHDPTQASRFNPDADDHSQYGPILLISIDTQPTSGTVSMKTTNRKAYDDARARAGIPPPSARRSPDVTSACPNDVILFNTSDAIMESSICNVAFYRQGFWLTPPLSVGCIPGVFRRWLLENGRIYEDNENLLLLDTIKHNEWVLVFNGVTGCQLGRIYRDKGAEIRADTDVLQ